LEPWERHYEREDRIKYVLHAQKTLGYEKAVQYSYIWRNIKLLGSGYGKKWNSRVMEHCHEKLL
jgi:hypothetical protein|tara:strand:+ start:1366 stop:1557 length:192 start_codon:yes stop_codon:yes gene_type:complete